MSEEFQKKLTDISKPEEKIQHCLDFMRLAIGDKTPRFKDFWECKKSCLPLFKEPLAPSVRAHLWGAYIEVSTEAKALKEILDEQSAFALEQIDLAIQALEQDLTHYATFIEQMPKLVHIEMVDFLREKAGVYNTLQQELNLLGTLAARVTALRKEVIKTDMRIRFKNKLFDRLSKAGDQVFPRRKELMKKISAEFMADVAAFVKTGLEGKYARDEIKALQSLAKELSLDTATFTATRIQLSSGWDLVKEKAEEKQEAFQKNCDLVRDKIKPLTEKCLSESCTVEEAMKMGSAILSWMKNLPLGRDDVRRLKEELHQAQAPVFERQKKEQEERERVMQAAQKQKQERFEQLKSEIVAVSSELSLEEMKKRQGELKKQAGQLGLNSAEKELVEELFKQLRDQILDRREKAFALSPEIVRSLDQLKSLLEARKVERQEIKDHLEGYRRALAGSGFDFEKAMRYRELLDAEKERLDKANVAIEEIEEKILELEGD